MIANDLPGAQPAPVRAWRRLRRLLLRRHWLFNSTRDLVRAAWYLRHATTCGARVRAQGRVVVQNYGTLAIGDRVQFVSTITPIELVVTETGTLTIGDQVFINYGTSIAATQSVTIGPRCNIGTYVNIIDNQFHCLEPERRHERPESAPVVIGANVWLGARVIVLPGVTIGADSVIGAGSVVTRSIPPRSLAVGLPARVIRSL